MKLPSKHTITGQVLRLMLDGKARTKLQITEALGLSELQAFAAIKRLREIGIIRLTGDGRYEIGHGGYSPGPTGGEAA